MRHLIDIVVGFLRGAGQATIFFGAVLAAVGPAFTRPRLIAQQVYAVGVLSMVIIVVSGSFVGMVLAL